MDRYFVSHFFTLLSVPFDIIRDVRRYVVRVPTPDYRRHRNMIDRWFVVVAQNGHTDLVERPRGGTGPLSAC